MRWLRRLVGLETDAEWNAREDREAEKRWLVINAAARAAGCRCGRPATHVRRFKAAGRVPAEVWSCEEHQNINGWAQRADGSWVPTVEYTAADLAWEVR